MLGILSFVISSGDFPIPDKRKIALVVAWSALLYFIAYLAQGFYAEVVCGISRFDTQGASWSGSAYAVFPMVIAIPAALYLLRYKSRNRCWLAVAVIITSLIVALYYDSRTSFLVILAYLAVSPIVLGYSRTALFLAVSSAVCLAVLGWFYFYGDWGKFVGQIQGYVNMLSETVAAIWSPRFSDVGRFVHDQAGFMAIGKNLSTALFGYGVNSHKFVIGPYLEMLYRAKLPGITIPVGNLVRTTGFTALLVDTGYIGILLLALNFAFTACEIMIQKTRIRIAMFLALTIAFLWLFVSNIQDIVLLYLMIMPFGLLLQLSRSGAAQQSSQQENWQNIHTNQMAP